MIRRMALKIRLMPEDETNYYIRRTVSWRNQTESKRVRQI